ncbi:MAG: BlaI/MecI/CopY family transcriptional regulator [Planctomycetota bacterium]
MGKRKPKTPNLGPLENEVMQVIWRRGSASAENIRTALAGKHELKDSTVRTILRRLEAKGVLTHTVEGRTFVYEPRKGVDNVVSDAVQQVADRFCKGSLSNLLLGMANDSRISAEELRELADKIENADDSPEDSSPSKKRKFKKN